MAVSDKNILITPNISGILGNQPSVVFTGADSSIGDSAAITATANPENSGTLNFSASEGQLFSISNNLTDGDIFTVNDVSGIPSLAIGANGIVKIAEYSGRILLGGATDDSTSLLQLNGHMHLADNNEIRLGNDSDLKIYHNGSNSLIQNSGTGAVIHMSDVHSFRNAANTEQLAMFVANGKVELYHNDVLRLETSDSGATVTGNLTADGVKLGDGEFISIGASTDLRLRSNGTHGYVEHTSGSGSLILKGNSLSFRNGADNAQLAKMTDGGSVELYENNVKKFETTPYGATVTGTINADSATFSGDVIFDSANCIFFDKSEKALRVAFGKEVRFADRGQAVFGSDKDLTIEHFSSFSGSIMENRTGFFKIYSHSGFNFKDSAVGHSFLTYIPSLNHRVLIAGADANGQSVTRINTVDSGVNITGNLRVNNQEFSSGASAGFAIAMAIAL